MPNRVVRRKRKGGLVPTGKSLRDARERRQMIARIQQQQTLENLFPDPPVGPPGRIPSQGSNDSIEDLQRRLDRLREADAHEPLAQQPERRGSVGDRPLYNSGSVVADHPREPERPLTLEEMNAPLPELDLRPQRRASVGGIKKRKSRKHRKHRKSNRKSKHNKKKHTRRRVNKKLKRNSRTRRR